MIGFGGTNITQIDEINFETWKGTEKVIKTKN